MVSSSQCISLPVKLKRVSTSVTWNTWWFSSTWKKDLFIAKPCKGDIKHPPPIRDLTQLFLHRLLDTGLMRCHFWPRIFLLRLDCFSCCHQVHSALLCTICPSCNSAPKNYVQPEQRQPWQVLCCTWAERRRAHVCNSSTGKGLPEFWEPGKTGCQEDLLTACPAFGLNSPDLVEILPWKCFEAEIQRVSLLWGVRDGRHNVGSWSWMRRPCGRASNHCGNNRKMI